MKTSRIVSILLLFTIVLPAAAAAQTLHAALRGQVIDTSGARCPNAQLRAVNEETGEMRRTASGPDGTFTIPVLSPGSYRIEAELAGFRKFVGKGIRLQVGQELRINLELTPGGPADEVVVTVRQDMLQTGATDRAAVIDSRQILDLPLDGRNFLQLSLLIPGTAPAAQGSPGSVRGEFSINANGAREDSNNFILDGVFNNDPKLNTFAINPPADAIREFEIVTSTYDAAFGRNGGAQVNVALKSGTNGFHGTAYEFFRNAALDARNYFASPSDPAPRYQRNQYGFSLGGPVRRDRTFFFADYEGRRMNEGITRVTNVPTELERKGDFSQSLFPPPIDPYTQAPFPNGKIPQYRINSVGSSIANLYPLPNRQVARQNYVSSPVLRDRDDRFDLRVDHALSGKSALVARYSFSDRAYYEPFSGPSFARIPGYGAHVPRRAQNFMLGEDHTFSSAFTNQVRFAFNRVSSGSLQEARNGSLNLAVGLPELSSDPRDYGLSLITISGLSPLGDEYNNPQHSTTNVFQFTETATLTRGRHLVKAGADFRDLQQNAFRDIQARGFLAFSEYGQVSGNGLADMLLGFITYSGGARLDNPQYLRTRSWNAFVQDSYRMRSNLTLLFGVRYEYNAPPVDRYDRANLYDPATRTLVPVGENGMPRSGFYADRNNWAPRVGLAWSPARATAIHAGYGVYYDQSSLAPGEGLYFNKPYYDFRMYFPLPGLPLTLNDPFPAGYPFQFPGSALGFDRNLRGASMQQWNLTIEHQFGNYRWMELAYVGSKGTKILSARDLNQAAPSPQQPNPRPVPQFADITWLESRGGSTYHSLQASYRQRLHAGFTGLLSYTLGKSLDTSSTFFSSSGDANFPQNSSNPGAEKGRSNFDVRHRFSAAYSYEFACTSGNRLLTGWSTQGIVTLQGGRPFTVALLGEIDNSNTGMASLGFGANNRPDRLASGTLANPGPAGWFDTRAFAFAPYGSFGNSGRNILDGPGYREVSLSVTKDSKIGDLFTLQFRAEFFNALNHTNFDLPDNFLGSPTFGTILSAQSPRRIQFGIKLIW
jgi:hypothetical protein